MTATAGDQSLPRPPRAVLWDVDGTLIDSAEYHYQTWRETLLREDYELTRADFMRSFGKRNDAVVRGFLGDDVRVSDIERISEAKEARYRALVRTRGIKLLPGVGMWLERLRAGGWRQAIASSAPPLNIEAILAATNLTHHFDALVSADEVEHGKPDPQIFLLAAGKLGTPPRRCVVVEDSPAGIEAGRRAGMSTIGVLTSHHELKADVVVRTLDDLPAGTFDQLTAADELRAQSV
jgi:beta-phosphoglucomutase family hydrolase